VDLGCGDFNVGKNFVSYCSKYIACDISSVILSRNQQLYKFENVEFRQLDLAVDELPIGDIAIVRQVLQHLSNADIANFVRRINAHKPYKYVLITEHFHILEFVLVAVLNYTKSLLGWNIRAKILCLKCQKLLEEWRLK
jgi:hypothetical protein